MDEQIDDLLRTEFRHAYPPGGASEETLDVLREPMRRARGRHQIAVRSTAFAALVAVAVGFSAVAMPDDPPTNAVVVAGPSPSEGSKREEGSAGQTSPPSPTIAAPPTAAQPTPTVSVPEDPTGVDGIAGSATGAGVTGTTDPPVPAGTTASHPDPSAPSAAVPGAPVVTTGVPVATTSQQMIQSLCGSVTVGLTGDALTLVSVNGHPGMAVDVKNEGPEEVEVGFESAGGHCEIKAESRGGVLWTDIDNDS